MDEWQVVHRYRALSARGRVPVLLCKDDDEPLFTSIGEKDRPRYLCYSCGRVVPTTDEIINRLRRMVEETSD